MKPVNLLPRSVIEQAALRRRVFIWSVAMLTYACITLAACIVFNVIGGEEHTRLEDHEGRLSQRIASAEAALTDVRRAVSQHRKQLEASETVGVHPDWSLLLRALASLRDSDIVLTVVDIKAAEPPRPPADPKAKSAAAPVAPELYELAIRGYGLSDTGVIEFTRRIEELDLMRSVHLKQTRAQSHLGVSAVYFDLACLLGEKTVADASAQEKTP